MGNVLNKRDNSFEAQHCTPLGLYPKSSSWDNKLLRKLVCDKKLACITTGRDDQVSKSYEECPICMLFYHGGLNRTRCCHKGMCTECFLQVKKPSVPATCPFCNHARFAVTFRGPRTKAEVDSEAIEDQKVVQLKIKMRQEEMVRDEERRLESIASQSALEAAHDIGIDEDDNDEITIANADAGAARMDPLSVAVFPPVSSGNDGRSHSDYDYGDGSVQNSNDPISVPDGDGGPGRDDNNSDNGDEDREEDERDDNHSNDPSQSHGRPFDNVHIGHHAEELEDMMVEEAIRLSLLDMNAS